MSSLEQQLEELKIQYESNKCRIEEELNQHYTENTNNILEEYNIKLELLTLWCYEIANDHHTLYLLDRINNCYHYYNEHHTDSQPQPLPETTNYHTFHTILVRKILKCDLIFEDENNKIYILTKDGLKRNKRREINSVIQTIIETKEFIYIEI
jgi:hypothetical protein